MTEWTNAQRRMLDLVQAEVDGGPMMRSQCANPRLAFAGRW